MKNKKKLKFVFLVQGEGRGHITQAIAMKEILEEAGHEISAVLVGKSSNRNLPNFLYQKFTCPVIAYSSPGLVMDRHQKKVSFVKTIIRNITPKKLKSFYKALQTIDHTVKTYQPDIIINFYDFLAGIYNKCYKRDYCFVCLGHQYTLEHHNYKYHRPKISLDRILMRTATWISSLKTDLILGLSFYRLDDIPKYKLKIVPPLLRQKILSQHRSQTNQDFILAYTVNPGYTHDIKMWCQKHPNYRVKLFSDHLKDKESDDILPNLTIYKINDVLFFQNLIDCKGYVSSAGFESICEAFYLGKHIMVVPTEGHYEQKCNAIEISERKIGIMHNSFDLSEIESYLTQGSIDNSQFIKWTNDAGPLILKYIESI